MGRVSKAPHRDTECKGHIVEERTGQISLLLQGEDLESWPWCPGTGISSCELTSPGAVGHTFPPLNFSEEK